MDFGVNPWRKGVGYFDRLYVDMDSSSRNRKIKWRIEEISETQRRLKKLHSNFRAVLPALFCWYNGLGLVGYNSYPFPPKQTDPTNGENKNAWKNFDRKNGRWTYFI